MAGVFVAGLLVPQNGEAQSEQLPILRGRVIDARTAAPLRDVNVTITSGRDTLGRARTDSSGAFQSAVSSVAASVIVHFNRIGYRIDSLATPARLELPLRVAMSSAAAATTNTLAAVVVRDTARSGFDRRARRNSGGAFIRLADIERKKPVRTSDLFRTFPGVRIEDSSGVTVLVSARSTRQNSPSARKTVSGTDALVSTPGGATHCVLRIGTDGRLMPSDFSVDDIRPSDVKGIEVYLGPATIPTEFSSVQPDAPCGLVMIWTKTGSER
jgi:hypothetical protein